MNPEIARLQADYAALCRRLGATGAPLADSLTDDGGAHIEIYGNEYHYVTTERGKEYERRITHDRDEALYWFVSDRVFTLASDYELHSRDETKDGWRIIFAKEVERMGQLSAAWAVRKQGEIDVILARRRT